MDQLPVGTTIFDSKKKTSTTSDEFWMGRDLQELLNYSSWERFKDAIDRSIVSCQTAGLDSASHFHATVKMIAAGNGARLPRQDYFLSRFACYLIAMNGDPSKPEIAEAQTYFAVQTRRQEIASEVDPVEARLEMRERLTEETKGLSSAAKNSGVTRFGLFNDAGTRGLYGGLGRAAVLAHKGLSSKDQLYDRVGTSELSAHFFKAEQTKEKLKRLAVKDEATASKIHHDVGAEIRKTIKNNGNVMPEDLPAEESIKKLSKAKAKALPKAVMPTLLPPAPPSV